MTEAGMHPGLEAWAKARAAYLRGLAPAKAVEVIAAEGVPATPREWTRVERQETPGEARPCELRGCSEWALPGPEALCLVHLRNLESWTKR